MTLKLTLHGKFTLSRDNQPISLRSKKAQALLVYLVLTGKPQSREHLAALLWGDRFDDQARRSLRQALHALRKAVGPDVVVGEDALQLAEQSWLVNTQTGPSDEPLLPDFRTSEELFDTWLAGERTRFNADLIDRHIQAAESKLASQEHDAAIASYQKAFALDPLSENTLRCILDLLLQRDRRADGAAIYEAFKERLKAELDVEPSRETLALAARLRAESDAIDDATTLSFAEITAAPHVVILPFENLGGGDMAAMVASEIASEVEMICKTHRIITAAPTKIDVDPVTGSIDALETARSLGAAFVLTGTVPQIGNTIRLSARYILAKDGSAKWVHREAFSGDSAFEDIAQLGKKATYKLALLLVELEPIEQLLVRLRQNTSNKVAFLKLWKSLFWRVAMVSQTRAYLAQVCELTEVALAFAPKETEILILLGFSRFHLAHLSDRKNRIAKYREAMKPIDEAFSRDPDIPEVLMQKLFPAIWLNDYKTVEDCYAALVNSGRGVAALEGVHGTFLVFQNRNDQAITKLTLALSNESGTINLFYRFSFLGLAHFNIGRFDEALDNANRALSVGREFFMAHLVKIAALERLGRHQDAIKALDDMRLDYRDPTLSEFEFLPFAEEAPKRAFLAALEDAGMPE